MRLENMQVRSHDGRLWALRDVFVGRCDADIFGDVRRVDIRCAGVRPKVFRRLIVGLGTGGQALVVLFRHAVPAHQVRSVQIRDADGRALGHLLRRETGEAPAQSLSAMLEGVREVDALTIVRGILAMSRATTWRGDSDGSGSTFARMVEFLSSPSDVECAPTPAGAGDRMATAGIQGAGAAGSAAEIHVLSTQTSALLDDDLLLFTGRAPWALPSLGQALIGDRKQRPVPVRCLSLDQEVGEAGIPFIGMVRSPELGSSLSDQLTVAVGGRRFHLLLGALERGPGSGVLEPLRASRPQAIPKIADFVINGLARMGSPAGAGPNAWVLLRSLLSEAGRSVGVIEIAGVLPGYGLLIQGWSRHQPKTRCNVIIDVGGCRLRRALFATFQRDDLGGDGTGFIGLIEAPDAMELIDLQRVHLREESCWSYLDCLEQGQRLECPVIHDHLRRMLPRLDEDASTLRTFRRVANGGFDGRDTISSLNRPLRIGLDFAVFEAGAGLLFGGWLLDPTRIVDCLRLRSTGGMVVELTQHWTRTARPDLNQAFGSDPLFAPHLSAESVRHGFMAFVPRPTAPRADEEVYIEATLNDDSVHFLPITFAPRADPAMLRRLLGSFDRNDPAASRLIERQIGPFVAASGRPLRLAPDQVTVLNSATPLRDPRRTVIVPIGPSTRDFDVNLASFAVDPDFAETQLVVVAPAALGGPAISALCHQASFYGLNLRLVVTQETLDACSALEVGAGHAAGDTLVFLSPSTFPRRRSWLGRLRQCFGDLGRPALISPTLLYEDDSIKFAGLHKCVAPGLQAAEAITSAFGGYPRHWLKGEDLTPALAATIDCCVLSRETLRRLAGFSHEFVTPELKSLDFMLRARIAGIPSFWLPTVDLVALDERFDDEGAYWFQNRLVVDEWCFCRKWSSYLAETREAA